MSREAHASAIRRVYANVLAKLLGFTGSLADAEDAVHDAIERGLSSWATAGLPDSPEAWLVTVAQNAHRDRQRRARRMVSSGEALETIAQLSPWARIAVAEPEVLRGFKDELLQLLFACCHPALEDGESAALALATVVGLSNDELARAFVVAPRSMEQRLTRARKRLRENGDVEGTTPERGIGRLPAVLRTVHLLFNEGYWSGDDESPIRADLCRLAIGLARSIVDAFPREPEPAGLLALLLFHDARRDARLDEDGNPIPLPDQDRARWDRDTIARAVELLERALGAGAPGAFQTEAAIAAVHCRAPTANATEWAEIASLYGLLEAFRPTPAVRVNRAFAVGKAKGPAEGLELLARADIDAMSYPYVHLVRGALLADAGEIDSAAGALRAAARLARNEHERGQIEMRLSQLYAQKRTPMKTSPEELFWQLAADLQRDDPRVKESTIMSGRCLRVSEEFLALVDYKGSGLVVKLPRERVTELVEAGVGKPFGPAGKIFKEWLAVPIPDRRRWRALLRESVDFVGRNAPPARKARPA